MYFNHIILTCLLWTSASTEGPSFLVKRHYKGDLFEHTDEQNCSLNVCSASGLQAVPVPWKRCQCQCLPLTPTFRQDIVQCVDTLDDCQLVPFQSLVASENIPLVSMPDSGKYVHPSAEIALSKSLRGVANQFNDVVCHVLMEKFLGPNGWLPLANLSHTGPVFQLVHNSKKILLQFVGDWHEKSTLDGHLIMVEFACKTKNNANIMPHPCAAFRVDGKQGATMVGTKNVLIAVESSTGSWRAWIIIGLGSGLLGVTYVLAILVYLIVRNRYEKKLASANSQLWSVTDIDRNRIERKALKMTSASDEATSLDGKNVDTKIHSVISFPETIQNPSFEENQSGPSHLLSQLRNAWNVATMKLRGRRLTFSSSLDNVTEESASYCKSIKSSESISDADSHCQSPQPIESVSQSIHSSTRGVSHSRCVRIIGGMSDPFPVLDSLRHSPGNQNNFADGSARIAIANKLVKSMKKKLRHFPGHDSSDVAHKENLLFHESAHVGTLRDSFGKLSEPSVDRCKIHHCSLTDSMQRKAASCENITVLTVDGASGLNAYSARSDINTWTQKKDLCSESQNTRWETVSLAKESRDHSLWRGQDKSMISGRHFGMERSESTSSIDGKRKSVSFDLNDTVILRDPSGTPDARQSPVLEHQPHLLYFSEEDCASTSDVRMRRSEIPIRKMTSFATLRWQSKSNEFLHLNDYAPHKSVIRIGRSESNAGEYGMRTIQRQLEDGEAQPLASILKRSESAEGHLAVVGAMEKRHPTFVHRSQSAVHPSAFFRQKCEQRGSLEKIPVKCLVCSCNPSSSVSLHGLENKRIWQLVNEDSGYHSSDSDRSLKLPEAADRLKCGGANIDEHSKT